MPYLFAVLALAPAAMSARVIARSPWYAAQSNAVEPSRDVSLTLALLAINARTEARSARLAASTRGLSPAAFRLSPPANAAASSVVNRNLVRVRILAPPFSQVATNALSTNAYTGSPREGSRWAILHPKTRSPRVQLAQFGRNFQPRLARAIKDSSNPNYGHDSATRLTVDTLMPFAPPAPIRIPVTAMR